jgi:hypothetical protein
MTRERIVSTSRRDFLKQAAGGAGLMAGLPAGRSARRRAQAMNKSVTNTYTYRIGFGAWINDMRNQPLPLQDWPAPQFDDATIEGAVRAMDVMSEAGYGYFDAFGLWATGDYPPDIVSAFQDKPRHKRLEHLFNEARRRRIGMVLPLGLFTWGYDRIIKEDPEVRGKDQDGNPHAHAMCGANERSWGYIEKLIDTAMGQFDFAGVHMESADLGWCMCPECGGRYGAVGYNCRLNIRAADYIKSRWPDVLVYTIPINWVPWRLTEEGMQQKYTREEFAQVVELSQHIDVFMDQGHRGNHVPPEWIPELQCDYGTSGGLWLYHSVRMNRLSYLIPYPKRACALLKRDYERGARACLYYQGPMVNPAVEVNTAVAGRIMNNVTRDPEEIVEEVIAKYYKPHTAQAGKTLAGIYLRIEDGFFGRWDPEAIKKAHHLDMPGEFSGWGLFGNEPEIPGHLWEPFLDKQGRIAYKDDLIGCLRDLDGIKGELGDEGRAARLTDALTLTVQFLKTVIAFKA